MHSLPIFFMIFHTICICICGLTYLISRNFLDKELVSMRSFHIYDPTCTSTQSFLVLDASTMQNLDVSVNSDGSNEGTVYKYLGMLIYVDLHHINMKISLKYDILC